MQRLQLKQQVLKEENAEISLPATKALCTKANSGSRLLKVILSGMHF